MPLIEAHVSCPVRLSPGVQAVARMFDVPLGARFSERFAVDVPPLGDGWRVGLIVGPSACGKTTIAERLFPGHVCRPRRWPTDRAVIDGLEGIDAKRAVELFTAVGFSSPPSWLRPYHTLSGGERFRCELARALALADGGSLRGLTPHARLLTPSAGLKTIVFDEFTSVIDRRAAWACSAAVSKAVRAGVVHCRFVAVTCHDDVRDWLAPDWTIDMTTAKFEWRLLRRPAIQLELVRCRRDAWRRFARHHYLSAALNPASVCHLGLWDGQPVAFCAVLALPGRAGRRRISRIVVLPDYQGLGIGTRMMEAIAQLNREQGYRVNITASHPAVIGHCTRSSLWRLVGRRNHGAPAYRHFRGYQGSPGRAVTSFEYVGFM